MPTTVIIPAHNEAAVIERCLRALTDGAADGELDVIVVANGCSDDTAAVARKFAPAVRVIETDVPSKAHALNLGDAAAAQGGPRVYVDADVVLSLASLRRVVAALAEGTALAAAPRPALDLARSSGFVRAYYGIDRQLPWFQEGIGNSGVYALSERGRKRFGMFPNITTDDSFVRVHFRPDERVTVADAEAVVVAPATLRALVAIKTRSHFSKWELKAHCPELIYNDGVRNGPALRRLARNPKHWPGLAVYVLVKVAARVRCRLKYRVNKTNQWERDETSRPPAATPAASAGEAVVLGRASLPAAQRPGR